MPFPTFPNISLTRRQSFRRYFWTTYIDNFGNWLIVQEFGPWMRIPVIINPIVTVVSELFFLSRAWKFQRQEISTATWKSNVNQLWFPALVVSLLLLGWGASIGAASIVFQGDIRSAMLTKLTEVRCSPDRSFSFKSR